MYRLIDVDELNKKIDEATYKAISAENWDLSMGLFKVKLMVGDMRTFECDEEVIEWEEGEEEPTVVS